MTQEEKAQAYDEALERAEKALEVLGTDKCEGARQIFSLFPELKESDDERIRKEIISALKYANHKGVYDKHLAWLEKQGDKPFDYENANIQQKDFAPKSAMEAIKEEKVDNANKVEPKFKIGDIISNGRVVYRVDGFGKNCVGNDSYFLVNVESEKDGIRYTSVCDSNGKVHNAGEIMWLCDQVDQMFQKVLEEKTEPTWSEEDSVRLQRIIDFLWYNRKGDTDTIYQQEQDIDWLKSLKERIGG